MNFGNKTKSSNYMVLDLQFTSKRLMFMVHRSWFFIHRSWIIVFKHRTSNICIKNPKTNL